MTKEPQGATERQNPNLNWMLYMEKTFSSLALALVGKARKELLQPFIRQQNAPLKRIEDFPFRPRTGNQSSDTSAYALGLRRTQPA